MTLVLEFLKIVLPASLVLYGVYLTVTSFIRSDLEKRKIELRSKTIEIILPNRLHAYERLILFVERMTPNELFLRLNNGDYTIKEFQQILLNEIRNEYNHNVSQQMYVSEQSWEMIKSTKENLIIMINETVLELNNEGNSFHLIKAVIEKTMNLELDIFSKTLEVLKNEISDLF